MSDSSPLDSFRSQFVGRSFVMNELQMRFRRALAGDPQFVVLVGPSGIGKSRIVQELYRSLTNQQDPSAPDVPHGYWPDSFGDSRSFADVNPFFADPNLPRSEIPWLWWGLKFSEPPKQGVRTDEGDALWKGLKVLNLHLIAAAARRQSRVFWRELLIKLGEFGTGFIPVVGNIPGWLNDLAELRRSQATLRRSRQEAAATLAETAERQRVTHAELALESLRLCADPNEGNRPGIPIVVWLDDAHWIDETSIGLIHKLWHTANERHWPLLLIATHWDDEWELHSEAPISKESPQRFRSFLDQLAPELRQGVIVKSIDAVDRSEAHRLLGVCFPGLTADQADLILDRAGTATAEMGSTGTNLRLLEQIIAWLSGDCERFENGIFLQSLRTDTVERLQTEQWTLHDVVKKRLEELPHHVKQSLKWSALQGDTFLAEITLAASDRIATTAYRVSTPAEIEEGLRRAERPQLLIHPRQGVRANIYEFLQRVFHDVALSQLGITERRDVDRAIDDILRVWLAEGKLEPDEFDQAGQLTSDEGREALEMAVRRWVPDSSVAASGEWGNALARLSVLYGRQYRWELALRAALMLAEHSSADWEPTAPTFWHFQVCDLLTSFRRFDAARLLLRSLEKSHGADITPLQRAGMVAERLGAIFLETGDRAGARVKTKESLEIRQQIVAEIGATPISLRNVCLTLDRLGTLDLAAGDHASARANFEASFELCTQIIDKFGATLESLRDISIARERVGDMDMLIDDRVSARARFEASLGTNRQVVALYGKTLQNLRSVSVSLNKVGGLDYAEGDRTSARAKYEESLELTRQNVTEFGATPQSLRDVSVSLERVAELDLMNGDRASARPKLEECLGLRRQIVAEFGTAPQSLRDISVSLNRLGDLDVADGDRASARHRFEESLELCRKIANDFGTTPESLRDINVPLVRVGEMDLAGGNHTSARTKFEEFQANTRRIVAQFGSTLERLRDISASLDRFASLDVAAGDRTSAQTKYKEILAIMRRIITEFGVTPQSMRDLGTALERVADSNLVVGDHVSARAEFEECLDLRRQIVAKFGTTPEGMREISIALVRLGDLDLGRGDRVSARAKFEESLGIRQWIIEFGATPQRLRDASVSLDRIGDLDLAEGNRASARANYEASMAIRRQIIVDFDATVKILRDLMVSLVVVGNLDLADGEISEARAKFEESLELIARIIDEFGATPASLQDLTNVRALIKRIGSDSPTT